jgi:hypothetical protein
MVGKVLENGAGCTRFAPGTLVACLTIYGAQAERMNVPEKFFLPVPEGLDLRQAAALILDWMTAYGMLEHSAKVVRGDGFFVHGGQRSSACFGAPNTLLRIWRCSSAGLQRTVSECPSRRYLRWLTFRRPIARMREVMDRLDCAGCFFALVPHQDLLPLCLRSRRHEAHAFWR